MTAYDIFDHVLKRVTTDPNGALPAQNQLLQIGNVGLISSVLFETRESSQGFEPLTSPSFSLDDFFFNPLNDNSKLHDINMISADDRDGTIRFNYDTLNNPVDHTGTFTVGLYEAPSSTFDPSVDKLVATTTVKPVPNSSGQGSFTIGSTPPASDPYLLVVADPKNVIQETNEANNVAVAWLVNLDELRAIMPSLSLSDAKRYLDPLNTAMTEFQITTSNREAGFLAQVKAESGSLTAWEETPSVAPAGTVVGKILSDGYTVISINMKNGAISSYTATKATSSGTVLRETKYFSGPNFVCYPNPTLHGRGPLMLTGLGNYKAVEAALGGLDIVDNPEWVSDTNNPSIGFRAAAAFWSLHGLNSVADAINPASSVSIAMANNTFTYVIRGAGGLSDTSNLNLRDKYLVQALSILTGVNST